MKLSYSPVCLLDITRLFNSLKPAKLLLIFFEKDNYEFFCMEQNKTRCKSRKVK